MGRDHSLAILRGVTAGLFVAWFAVVAGFGQREAVRASHDRLALGHSNAAPKGDAP